VLLDGVKLYLKSCLAVMGLTEIQRKKEREEGSKHKDRRS